MRLTPARRARRVRRNAVGKRKRSLSAYRVKTNSGARPPRGTPRSAALKIGSMPSVTSSPRRPPASVALLKPRLHQSAARSRGCAATAAARVPLRALTQARARARAVRQSTPACGVHDDDVATPSLNGIEQTGEILQRVAGGCLLLLGQPCT